MSRRSPQRPRDLDAAAVDAIVAGGPVDAGHDRLAIFARLVRTALFDVPDPRPSAELAELLRGAATSPPLSSSPSLSLSPSLSPARARARRIAGLVARVAGLGVMAKVGLGASLAAASVTGAGAAGVLPAPARDAVRDAIERVTPVDFGGQEAGPSGRPGRASATTTTTTAVSAGSSGSELRLDPGGAADDGSVPPDSTGRDRAHDRAEPPGKREGERRAHDRETDGAGGDAGDGDEGDEEAGDEGGEGGYGGNGGDGAAGDGIEHVVGGAGTGPAPDHRRGPGKGHEIDEGGEGNGGDEEGAAGD